MSLISMRYRSEVFEDAEKQPFVKVLLQTQPATWDGIALSKVQMMPIQEMLTGVSNQMDSLIMVGLRRAFIYYTDKAHDSPVALAWPAIDRAAEAARRQGWWYRTLPTDHSPNHTMPHELADLLLELAQ